MRKDERMEEMKEGRKDRRKEGRMEGKKKRRKEGTKEQRNNPVDQITCVVVTLSSICFLTF
jgi:hypothetical protein